MAEPQIKIGDRLIGRGEAVYVIAEMSANHNRDFEQAAKILHEAKDAGANAVKLQTYTPETLTIDCEEEYFRVGEGTVWQGKTLYDLYSEASMPWEWQPKLMEIAEDLGLDLFSTPFDRTAVYFLEDMKVQTYKVASFEIVDLALLRCIAATGKPIIMSTGMATLFEIDEAVRTVREAGCDQLALMKCTSAYPAPPEEMNLRTIPHLAEAFQTPVGISDHTLGTTVPVAAVALGASIVEKHFTLSRQVSGPDSAFSLEPIEFKQMVEDVRVAEAALGQIRYEVSEHEQASRTFRRSLFIVENMTKGERFTEKNVRSIRPGYGLHPRYLPHILGLRANSEISKGTPLQWELVTSD